MIFVCTTFGLHSRDKSWDKSWDKFVGQVRGTFMSVFSFSFPVFRPLTTKPTLFFFFTAITIATIQGPQGLLLNRDEKKSRVWNMFGKKSTSRIPKSNT